MNPISSMTQRPDPRARTDARGDGPPSNDDDAGGEPGGATQISEAAARKLEAMAAFLQKLRDRAAAGAPVHGDDAAIRSHGSSAKGRVIDSGA